MTNKKGIVLGAMLLAFITSPLMAQRRNADANGQRGGAATLKPSVNPTPKSPAELEAFNAIRAENNATQKIALTDQFIATYPNSELLGFVQRFRMETFTRLAKYKESITAGEQGLALETKYLSDLIAKADAQALAAKNAPKDTKKPDKNAPPPPPPIDKNSPEFKALVESTQNAMLYYYQSIMNDYQQLNDAPKTIEWAEKALGEQPDNLLTLLTLSSVMAARPSADPKEMEKQMKEAEEHSKKAIAMLTAMLASPMAAQMPAEDKASLQSTAHGTLGRIYYNTKKYPDAQKEFGLALAAKKDDGDSLFYLGLSLAQDKPPKVDEAMDSLAKSIFLKGPTEAQANDILKQLYQNRNKTMDGYDDFIKKNGAKINP